MKVERVWKDGKEESWKEITEERVDRECANAHGDNAFQKLKIEKN